MKTCKFRCGQKADHQFKDGTWCCSSNVSKCPKIKRKMSRRIALIQPQRTKCKFCNKKITISNLKKHEKTCYMNPKNVRLCPVCGNHIKDPYTVTCSHVCKNEYFKEMYVTFRTKPDDELKNYRTICFRHHEERCVVCGEKNIVEVHHYDGDKTNNNPYNLIPLCPTHHKYMHSKFRLLIEVQVSSYINLFEARVA